MEKTYVPKGKVEQQWILVDAEGQTLGRLASVIAQCLMGKDDPRFTPGVDMGKGVVVINVSRINVFPERLMEKMYYTHSNYPGGLSSINLRDQLAKYPERVIRHAVWGMIPHTKLGRQLIKRVKVYAGSEHPHGAQNPEPVK